MFLLINFMLILRKREMASCIYFVKLSLDVAASKSSHLQMTEQLRLNITVKPGTTAINYGFGWITIVNFCINLLPF